MTFVKSFRDHFDEVNISNIPRNIATNLKSFKWSLTNIIHFLMPFMHIYMGLMYCYMHWLLIFVGVLWIVLGFVSLSGHSWKEQKRASLALHIISPLALLFTLMKVNWMTIVMWSMHGAALIYFAVDYIIQRKERDDEAIGFPKEETESTPLQELEVIDIPLYTIK